MIKEQEVKAYIVRHFGLTEKQLFNAKQVSFKKRTHIFNQVFDRYTGHILIPKRGLVNRAFKSMDMFDNYESYHHIESIIDLTYDLNKTKKQSVNKVAKLKRGIHLARKRQFKARQRRKMQALNRKRYNLKWEPKNAKTKARFERLQKMQEQEIDQEYER